MKLNIGKAETKDVQALVNLYKDAYSENERMGLPASASRVTVSEVEDWSYNSILLKVKNQVSPSIIGTVRLKYSDSWQCYVLGRLAVKSSCKGQGIATRLMDYAESELCSMKEKKIRLTVAQNHPYLKDMYQKKGYNIVAERLLQDLPYDEYIMEKSL